MFLELIKFTDPTTAVFIYNFGKKIPILNRLNSKFTNIG